MPLDLPPYMQERVVCSITAAAKYEIPANIVLAVAEKENGRAGQWVRNSSNGSHDVGPLQFNTNYLRELAQYGIAPSHVAASGCYSFELAAWRLRKHIKNDTGDVWTRAANYHSRTPQFNKVYRTDLMVRAAKWADWLSKRYQTYDQALPTDAHTTAASSEQRAPVAAPVSTPAWSTPKYVPRRLIVGTNAALGGNMR
ncbi:transglycosylase SLT domain-containing protein [Massilia sp. TSP1-1-2]|uniref:transglycosylase SLT domain-containing protein n=1 Tax=Massilia sp. TSP1-1-2 TaxID=2804649 RepID=UPI003CEC7798